jgi:hypothetical protein
MSGCTTCQNEYNTAPPANPRLSTETDPKATPNLVSVYRA